MVTPRMGGAPVSVLLCTLGGSWAVVPELAGLVWPAQIPLFQNAIDIVDKFKQRLVSVPDQLWVVTTSGPSAVVALERLVAWWTAMGEPFPLKVWKTDAQDGDEQQQVERIRELIFRAVLAAGKDCVISLAGGRKTMSADMQHAGLSFGCSAMLHVIAPDGPMSPLLSGDDISSLTRSLPEEVARTIQPVWVGEAVPLEVLELDPEISAAGYPLPDEGTPFHSPGPEGWLWRDLSARKKAGGRLLANFYAGIAKEDVYENWRSLYRLAPSLIRRLRKEILGDEHRSWLQSLPKAELHCHLGGFFTVREQVQIGWQVWDGMTLKLSEIDVVERVAQEWWKTWKWPQNPILRQQAAALVLMRTPEEELERRLFEPTLPRLALNTSHERGFAAYDFPGSLMGSTLLATRDGVELMAKLILERCQRENIAYIELRCSPQKYYLGEGLQFIEDLFSGFQKNSDTRSPIVRVIIIADRRRHDDVEAVVRLAVEARARFSDFVVGLDLAGDEQFGDFSRLSASFQDAFRECLPLTIHAGEGQAAENIWNAAYQLHADRIGHGLTLADRPELMKKFRNRRIALELCPTSNIEVVGFRDPARPGSGKMPNYPFRRLWEAGMPLTVNTDNPGISRTTLMDEYLTLSRLDGCLTLWETLSLVKQAFLHSFLDGQSKERLLKGIDEKIFNLCLEHFAAN